ncbi:DUF5302 family protein [Nocardioides sp.]|uniref:DUF5302 family protein n=1 Tax=Nocardioides sp. TaxID=35761 RepID=UPI0035122884
MTDQDRMRQQFRDALEQRGQGRPQGTARRGGKVRAPHRAEASGAQRMFRRRAG